MYSFNLSVKSKLQKIHFNIKIQFICCMSPVDGAIVVVVVVLITVVIEDRILFDNHVWKVKQLKSVYYFLKGYYTDFRLLLTILLSLTYATVSLQVSHLCVSYKGQKSQDSLANYYSTSIHFHNSLSS